MVDNPSQLPCAAAIASAAGHPPLVFLKIDAGYGRAGVPPSSPQCEALVAAALAEEARGGCVLHGVYSHAGHSYGARDDWRAMEYLAAEFAGLAGVARLVRRRSPGHELVLSVGATPTATAVQYPGLLGGAGTGDGAAGEVNRLVEELRGEGFKLEVHAGV